MAISRNKLYYGWVIVAVATVTLAITYGIMYSYGVFFKPLVAEFSWDRATVSAVYSLFLFLRGAASVGVGWLADRFGAVKLTIFCGFMAGLGLMLTSQVNALWQIYLTFGLIEAVGLSGSFAIGSAMTARWFPRNRGLALGITSSGVGFGTLVMVPAAERIINASDWSTAFVIFAIAAWLIIIPTAFLLKPNPQTQAYNKSKDNHEHENHAPRQTEMSFREASCSRQMAVLLTVFFLFIFCFQMVIVHLVNYATDVGISPLVAASFVGIIGAISIGGRLLLGVSADKIGAGNALIICCVLLTASLVLLLFTRTLWAFYLFAAIFGFAYGGEVPQIPIFIGKFFGTRAMSALVGLVLFVANIGGALGPWVAGKIFDTTSSYQLAFMIAVIASFCALLMALVLRRCRAPSSA